MATREKAPELLAYMAGIVDGEGCINIYPNRAAYSPRVSVYNSCLELLNLFQTEFGGTIVIMRHGGTIEHPKKTYHWHVGFQDAIPILNALFPYLRVKKEQASILLEYLDRAPSHKESFSPEVRERRRLMYVRMKELNGNPRRLQRLNETKAGTA